ncbi:toxin [Bacillus sp. HMF5848]|uniref:anthrax toxin lethal factor-related metalloendopeptidase n=1 Tax=Bacillus sp. HMF5848 TaxID=2495421 RepID=UPI000F77BEF7|nr:toxin [Bacillus sp. HMF5848]RSK27305.1 toxin [Bacillus sp. HMF5848]
MNRLITMICMIIVVVPLSSAASLPPGIPLFKYNSIQTDDPYLKQIILLPYHSFDELEAHNMIHRISKIDSSILQETMNNGVKLTLFTGKLTEQRGLDHLKGKRPEGYSRHDVTWDYVPGMGGGKIAYAKIGASDYGNGHSSINLELHELAHSIDKQVYSSIHNSPNFLEIWKKEAPVLFPNQPYLINYPEEYFAEAFALYHFNTQTNEYLKKHAHKTYLFMLELKNVSDSRE